MPTDAPHIFDRLRLRQRLDRAAGGFEAADFLHRRAAEDVAERLGAVTRDFPRALAMVARRGGLAAALKALTRPGQIGATVETDLSGAMLAGRAGARVQADEERSPFREESFELVVAGLGLHALNDLVGGLIQIRRTLRPDGLFLGSLLGGATLQELRQSLLEADLERSGGAGPRVAPFADAFDGAAVLQRAGFALPVSDIDRVRIRYEHPLRLLQDLRAMGETSVLSEGSRTPLSRGRLRRAMEIYAERFSDAEGRALATFEIVSLTGWAPHASQPKALRPGSARVRLADALGVREQKLDL